ncbi:undecaprenyl-phosphate glucose phosphotransferase [Vibrio hannami]|uniref:undecaprenyl-phosphate glucose phosphotransferase n=1 Tax=Vibrio hannami TaxID=2717094 RepID=UPI00241018BE|nr:undecaprenyl-phosphate glucose phosphotransferase [Vibrio hannami]MDG3088261.1 undecaprenyl-phosphate glucose phosphotransferase [Vibrio hannami]
MLIYRVVDIFTICALLIAASSIYVGAFSPLYQLILSVVVVAYSLVSEVLGVYQNHKYSSFKQIILTILATWFICVAVSLGMGFFFKIGEAYSRVVLGFWFVATPLSLLFWRCCVFKLPRYFRPRDSYKDKSIIIGATRAGILLANELKTNKHIDENLLGFYDDRTPDRLSESVGTSKLPAAMRGNIDDALRMAKNRSVKNVYIALPMEAAKRIKQILNAFADSNAHVHVVPDFFTFDLMHSRWKNVGNVVTLSVHDTPFRGFTSMIKRVEDVVLASIIIVLISPVLAAVALGVKLSSKGPVIFKQDRYGLDGRPIKVWKFRSMRSTDNGPVVKQATKDDPRITPFGAFIRRTSLDELPQFFNVLTGQMSIVGPRPHAVAHNEEYRGLIDKYMLRHHVKPGITGWAQINGYRGETDTLDKMEKRVEYDLTYIQNWSIWLDIKIVFLTVFKGFVGKTAY